ncbi:hypothetical protein MXB_1987 [Myxobolus squamalis]|nr:hypothetical protein MXB_1987 [Myxobolus squamalis]
MAVSKLLCDLPALKTTQISCLYSKRGFEKVNSLVDSAIKTGAICFYQDRFSSDSQLMEEVNDSSHGLAGILNLNYIQGYVYSQNIKQIFKTVDELNVGLIAINDSSPSTYLLPFGGHKESGIGSELGSRAIYNYMDTKSVVFNHNEDL